MIKLKDKEIIIPIPYMSIGNSAKTFGGQKIIFIRRVFKFIRLVT